MAAMEGQAHNTGSWPAFHISHFGINAVIRGFQLTLVGAHRALQNPSLFTSEHYRQAAVAVAAGVGIRLAVAVPTVAIRACLLMLSTVVPLESTRWDDKLIDSLQFVENYVLHVPFFLMALVRYVTPTLDNLFMDSLEWVDTTYIRKHAHDDQSHIRDMFYPHLRLYRPPDKASHPSVIVRAVAVFLSRSWRRALVSLSVFALSYLPLVGHFVLPAASFYTFNRAVGLGPATVIFGTGMFLPRRYLVIFLQTYFASRSLVRELLEPYFSRIPFSKEEKRNWFRSREGILFGFGIGFYILIRVPLFGVLAYGIAEASTAYLVTKITDPPPTPEKVSSFTSDQQAWNNKHEILDLSLANLDSIHFRN